MDIEQARELAKKNGFQKAEYVGKYKGYDVYKPLHEPEQAIGLPFFILSLNGEMKLVTGETGLKIIDALYKENGVIVKDNKVLFVDAESDEEEWKTINGNHVLVKGGKVVIGPAALKGEISGSKSAESASETTPSKMTLKDGGEITCGKPMTHEEADNGKVNPHQGESRYYTENCQSCVMAYEMRLRGYDVEAKGRNVSIVAGGYIIKDPSKGHTEKDVNAYQQNLSLDQTLGWKDRSGRQPAWTENKDVTTPKKAEVFLQNNVEPGGRYFMSLQWKGGGSHIVTVSKDPKGELVIYDPQNNTTSRGSKEIKDTYLSRMRYKGSYSRPPKLLRVDTLQPNIEYAENVLIKSGAKEKK